MTEPLFFKRPHGLTAGEIAKLTAAEPHAKAQLDRRIINIAPLDRAGPQDLAFLDRAKYAAQLASTCAGICLISERFSGQVPERVTALIARDPYRSFVAVARELFPDALRPIYSNDGDGIAPEASVHRTARLEAGVTVGPGAVIGARAEIGSGTVIAANAVIGNDVRIGRGCTIGPGATVFHALIGDRVFVHPGAHLGQDGFGYLPGEAGHLKVPQVGRVIIQDDVEIGAGTAIDRGASRDTTIGEGTKIDNLVQIGHNVTIGRHCIIVGQTGISGSVTIGDYAMIGGQVGIVDHLTLGEGIRLAAKSGLMNDMPAGAQWAGAPAKPAGEFFRELAQLKRLAKGEGASRRKPNDDDPG
jgi:UDP-3-O-[3-hydroxymyristoyl] glucosamine N-acyltransferase